MLVSVVSVSYTHLDVYKRQVCVCVTLIQYVWQWQCSSNLVTATTAVSPVTITIDFQSVTSAALFFIPRVHHFKFTIPFA